MAQIKLLPATKADIPTLARMAGDAFTTDRHTTLKSMPSPHPSSATHKPPYNHEEGMKGALEQWISISDVEMSGTGSGRGCVVLKAVQYDERSEDGEDGGEIMGWVCWGYRGLKASPSSVSAQQVSTSAKAETAVSGTALIEDVEGSTQQGSPAAVESQSSDKHSSAARSAATSHEDDSDSKDDGDSISRLEALTDAHMDHWIRKLMPSGTSCFYIMSVVVAPKHQGKGVGSALVRYGTGRAQDASKELGTNVFCWVHSSEAGVKLFEKEGFKQMGRLDVILDEFAGGRKVPQNVAVPVGNRNDGTVKMGWGTYVFRYLKWMPQ